MQYEKYTETEDYEKGFAEYYEKYVVPVAEKYEPDRIKKKKQHYLNMLLGASIGIAGFIGVVKSSWYAKIIAKGRRAGQFIILVPMTTWWFFVRRPKRKYFQSIKKEICPLILKYMGDFRFYENLPVDEKVLASHGLYSPNLFNMAGESEDCVVYRGSSSVVSIMERQFWGLKGHEGHIFILFHFNQSMPGDFLILSKSAHQGDDAKKRAMLKKRKSLKKVEAVNPKFDKQLALYAENEVVARSWLVDSFIDELLDLNKAFNIHGIICSIVGRTMLVELKSRGNYFEPGKSYSTPILNVDDVKRLLSELHFVVEVSKQLENHSERLRKIAT